MADPAKLYKHLPDAYDKNSSSDQYKLLSAIETGFTSLRSVTTDLINEQTISTATGNGLTRRVESRGLFRPPGMDDTTFRSLSIAVVKARRCTLAAIKEVFEIATGVVVDVEDKHIDGAIPSFEIRITPSAGVAWPSYGRGAYAGIGMTELLFAFPLRSAIAGPVLDELGIRGGFSNDFAWWPVSIYTMIILDKIRPAGTYYKFIGA